MMSLRSVSAAACVAVGSSVDLSVHVTSSLSSLTLDASSKARPVAKVITVLGDMLKQLEKEASEDEELYETMTCWCETNDREKTKAIADAEAKIEDLGVKIEELTARSGKLGVEIKNLEKEVGKNQGALDKATEIRQKELSEFNDEEKDLLGSISALKSAVTVLGKHNSASLLQLPKQHMQGIAKTLDTAMSKHQDMLTGVFTHTEKKAVTAFIQSAQDPSSDGSYAPASGQIFGILNQMKETFETNLSDSQKMEMNKQNSYTQVKTAKVAEIQAGQNQIDKKTEELAQTDESNAQAKQDLKDTKANLSADEEFLMMLKKLCSKVDAEYEARTKERNMEMEACSKALAVLSSDEAHDMFTKTFNFLQTSSKSSRRADASAVLRKAASNTHSQALSALALKVRLDAFEKVKKAINDMVAALTQEKADEIKHKDFCVEEFNSNQLATEKKTREKEELVAQIEDLEMNIKQLTADLDSLKSQITEMKIQMKRAGEDREKENKEFQMTVADQRATQKLLQAALEILKGFYDKKNTTFDKVSLLQKRQSPPPMTGFKDYSKNKQSGGVMGMIQSIITDAKAMENEAIVDEENAQKGYEDFVKETNNSIDAKTAEIIEKTEENAKAKENHVEKTEAKDNAVDELDELSEANGELHASCDFVMKNFELRQSSRDEEIEALKQAMAILSGAKLEDA